MSSDTVIGGAVKPAGNVLFGHFGRVQTVDASGNVIATYGYGGRGDLVSSKNLPAQWIYSTVLDNGSGNPNKVTRKKLDFFESVLARLEVDDTANGL